MSDSLKISQPIGPEIVASEARCRALVTATSDIVYSMNPDWSVMQQLDGRGFLVDTYEPNIDWRSKYIHPDDLHIVDAVISEAIKYKKMFELEHRVLQANGSIGWTYSRAVPILNEQGEIVEWFGAASDVTARKHWGELRTDFIGMISHELKTPLTSLNAIIQFVNAKLKDSTDSFLSKSMTKANLQIKKMMEIINAFLNISRLESGEIPLHKSHFDITQLLEEVIEETDTTTFKHHISLIHHISADVYADKEKISAVVNNLISNAAKYSADGTTIELDLKQEGKEVVISVKDEGIGINSYDAPKIFERYHRVENEKSPYISGFGIGLYLSAEIVKKHNGRIWVESEFGSGSTFYFSLPVGG